MWTNKFESAWQSSDLVSFLVFQGRITADMRSASTIRFLFFALVQLKIKCFSFRANVSWINRNRCSLWRPNILLSGWLIYNFRLLISISKKMYQRNVSQNVCVLWVPTSCRLGAGFSLPSFCFSLKFQDHWEQFEVSSLTYPTSVRRPSKLFALKCRLNHFIERIELPKKRPSISEL